MASIIGFIIGSLGVVWPWKRTLFKTDTTDQFLYDSTGKKIVLNYERYLPELNTETLIAFTFIIIGIIIVLALERYGQKTKTDHV